MASAVVALGAVVSGVVVGVGPAQAAPAPALGVETLASGLSIPWEVVQAPDGTIS